MTSFDDARPRILAALRAVTAAANGLDAVEVIRNALQPDIARAEPAVSDAEKQMLELVMRMHMEELLAVSKEPGQTIEAAGVPRLLDVAIALAADECAQRAEALEAALALAEEAHELRGAAVPARCPRGSGGGKQSGCLRGS